MSDLPAAEPELEEPREETFFRYSASLRIFGNILSIDELSRRLGVSPTHTHRRGDRRGPDSTPYEHDMWRYVAPVPRSEPLHVHIDKLWSVFKSRKHDLLQLKNELTVDVFLGYRSNSDNAGVEVPSRSLEMFIELQVPFGLSIIVT
jgi:hypothetical protein